MSVVTYPQIREEIAYFIGSPQDRWDSVTVAAVENAIRTGIDQVVHNGSHQWSWMRPRWQMSTSANQRRYSLPLDFEQFTSDIYFDGVNYQYPPITQLPASRLMQLTSETTSTGVPSHYAIEVATHDGATAQSSVLVLDPTPDATYQLQGIYAIAVRPLSDSNPYPPGGDAHGELFLASCLAKVESKFFDAVQVKQMEFQDMMANHINIDLRRQPRNLGPMGGRSVTATSSANMRRMLGLVGRTTINGTTDL